MAAPGRLVTEEQRRYIMEAFHAADQGNKGFLNREDLKVAIVSLFGYKPSKYEVDELMSKAKVNTDKRLGMHLENFIAIAGAKFSAQDLDDEIRQIFVAFDIECRGFITLENAKKIFFRVAPFVGTDRVEKVFKEIDSDKDRRISFRDFEFMMKYSVEDI